MNISATSCPKQRVAFSATRHDRSVEGWAISLGMLPRQSRYGLTVNKAPGKQVSL